MSSGRSLDECHHEMNLSQNGALTLEESLMASSQSRRRFLKYGVMQSQVRSQNQVPP